jgi:hypothetical protein
MKRRIKAALVIAGLLVLVLAAAMAAYIAPATLEEGAYAALVSDEAVRVAEGKNGISLLPTVQADRGFIFYTGARVPPAAYAAILKPLAQRGIAVFIPRLPFNFAIFDIERAGAIIAENPGITRWYLGGHSLGGASAAFFVHENPDAVEGIAFLASYPAGQADLSSWRGRALSLAADQDGLATLEKFAAASAFLPRDTVAIVLEGANHAGFGRYGQQKGDGSATMPKDEQERRTAEALYAFILGE